MLGTFVNAGAIILGAVVGILLRTGIAQRFRNIIMQGLGLAVALIGLRMALKTNNELIIIFSLVIGGFIGEAINIDLFLQRVGHRLNSLIKTGESEFVKAFVSTTLIYCVGAMSIMGSLESGLTGQHTILYAKAVIDGFSAIIFASTMGLGVIFSSLSVIVYQGSITLLAGSVKTLMTEPVLNEMTAAGGILILAIASNVLEIKEFKVANLLPAVLIAIIITIIYY